MGSAFRLGLFLAAALILAWMLLLPFALEALVAQSSGASLDLRRASCNPFGLALRMEGAELGQPRDFEEEGSMMSIRFFEAKLRLESLGTESVVVESVHLDLSRLVLVIDSRGKTNLEALARGLFGESIGVGEGARLRKCCLKIDTVEMLDYSQPVPSPKTLRLGVDVEDFEAEGAVGLFDPLFEILRRANYLERDALARRETFRP